MDTLQSLTVEWQNFCNSLGLPAMSMDEFYSEHMDELAEHKLHAIRQFILRWETAVRFERKR